MGALNVALFGVSLAVFGVAFVAMFRLTSRFSLTARLLMMLFPFSQITALGYFSYIITTYAFPLGFSIGVLVVSIFCAASDIALMQAIRSDEAEEVTRQRARLLEEQLRYQKAYGEQLAHEREQSLHIMDEIAQKLHEANENLHLEDGERVAWCMEQAAALMPVQTHYCSHRALDALLVMKAQVCKEVGINLMVEVDLPQTLDLPSVDICALFANALDNAIHACTNVEASKRSVEVSAHVSAGHFIMNVTNSCTADANIHLPDRAKNTSNTSTPATDGSNGEIPEHGWGLSIMQRIAKRHDGIFTIAQHDATCEVCVVMRADEVAA